VALLKKVQVGEKTLDVFECGGSLIHPKVVMTGEFYKIIYLNLLYQFIPSNSRSLCH
jgi:hypothetical protein